MDEISDWAIAFAHGLADYRLAGDAAIARQLSALREVPEGDAFQVLLVLPRVIGLLLRPGGWAGGPIGVPVLDRGTDSRVAPEVLAAGRLIGLGAEGDHETLASLAHASVPRGAPRFVLLAIVMAMLEVLAREPVVPALETPE